MIKYLLVIPLICPLIGVMLMERGAFGVSIGQHGYPNGVSLSYLLYVSVFLIVFILFKKRTRVIPRVGSIGQGIYRRYFFRVCLLHILMILVMLFLFDAHLVWSKSMGKGEFRATLGNFGYFAYTITKYISPFALAYMTFLYVGGRRNIADKFMLVLGLIFGLVFGSTWGFKTTGLFIILPSLLIIYWEKGIWSMAKLGMILVPLILFMGIIFDNEASLVSVVESTVIRLTVIQGDVSWLIWDKYISGEQFPSYIKTLPAVIGDRMLTFFLDLDRNNYQEWVLYHYDLLINDVVGLPLENVKGGHTIVGTPFSEGLIFSGITGILVFAVFGGWLCAFLHNKIQKSLVAMNGFAVALWSTYFCVFAFSWMIGGAIVQLFHISVFAGFLLAFLTVYLMRVISLDIRKDFIADVSYR